MSVERNDYDVTDKELNGVNNSPAGDISTVDIAQDSDRPSSKFGRQCFRQNLKHRLDIAHPGDIDYLVPDMPEANKDAPKCKYSRDCYRLNPDHFRNFNHPRNINIQQNYRKYVLKRRGKRRNSDSSLDNFSDDNTEDPFAGDSGGSDYKPSDEKE